MKSGGKVFSEGKNRMPKQQRMMSRLKKPEPIWIKLFEELFRERWKIEGNC